MADWRDILLNKIRAPINATNLEALQLWADSEGIDASCNNVLAATDFRPGATPYPPAPAVWCYVNVAQMTDVYAFKLGTPIYAAIGSALRSADTLSNIFRAINASPWCAGCQQGHYPVALYNVAFQGVAPPAPGVGGTIPPPAAVTGGSADPTQAHAAFKRLQLSIMRDLPRNLNSAGSTLRAARRHLARPK